MSYPLLRHCVLHFYNHCWSVNTPHKGMYGHAHLLPDSLCRAARFEDFQGILGFSVPSIILAELLGNTCLP